MSATKTVEAPRTGNSDAQRAEPLLDMGSVEVIYDRVFLAIKGVSLVVPDRGMVALLGANGAGKSTTLKAVSGLLGPERGAVTRGVVRFRGAPILALPPHVRVRRGLVHVLEGRRVFEHLTPEENLVAASMIHRDRRRVPALKERVYTYFPRLAERRAVKAGYLSGGEQQMLAIGRALMTAPRLLLLDEPSLGLAPVLVAEIFEILKKINGDEGVAVLLVEQNATAALEVVQHAYLLENGRVIMAGASEALRQNPDVQEFYLGAASQRNYHDVKHYRRRKRWLA